MSISIMDGPVAVTSGTPSDIIRLEDNHALAIISQAAAVVDINGATITVGSVQSYDTGADQPKAVLVDPTTYKVAVAYGQPSRYLRAAILDCDLGTDSFTYNNALLRDSFTENPSFFEILWSGAICSHGNMFQVFWMERSGGVVGVDNFQLWCMTVDCSGSSPVAGTPVKYLDTTPIATGYGVPALALLMGNGSGVILYTSNHFSTFTFGGSPSAPQSVSGVTGSIDGVVLPGNVGFGSANGGNGLWCDGAGVMKVSPPTILTRVDKLQTRTILTANATHVERVILNGSTIDSVDNNFQYCSSSCGSVAQLAVMGANREKALVLNGSCNAWLLGGLPTDDPFPYHSNQGMARLYWGTNTLTHSRPIEVS